MPSPFLLFIIGLLSNTPWCDSLFVMTWPRVIRTPDNVFKILPKLGYPWKPNYLDLTLDGFPSMRMHYLDLGPTQAHETILLLHGTPTWSFLYRKMIPRLTGAGCRVIAPDFIGFGRSDKLTSQAEYTHDLHVQSLLQLVKFLDLQHVTLFGHDLGGPTGLSVVRRESNRFKRLILLNTWIPQGDIFASFSFAFRHAPYLAWRATTRLLGRNIPLDLVFAKSTDARLGGILGYMIPFPSYVYKAGPAQWPLLIPMTINDPMAIEMQRVQQFLQKDWSGRVLFGYSDRELFTTPGGDVFRDLFADQGCEVQISDAGHFLQEDKPITLAEMVISFNNGECPETF